MKQNIFIAIATLLILNSCVTQKKYDDLATRKSRIEAEKADCEEKLTKASSDLEELTRLKESLEVKHNALVDEHEQVSRVLKRTKEEYDHLEGLHDRLTDKYNELLKLSAQQSNQLSSDLSKREQEILRIETELRKKQEESNKLEDELMKREQRVKELEQILADQQKAVELLKSKVTNALLSFKDNNELTVEVKNGKVYVSLAEQLLFRSGSTKVDSKGQDALVKLANVLKEQKDLNVMVEGHTDDVPMSPTGGIKDNWDLSVMRATEIVRILTSNGVESTKVSASGRAEFMPVDMSKTKEGRAKNRRTEIILTPKLDELFQMLE